MLRDIREDPNPGGSPIVELRSGMPAENVIE
jgi:hypothetical protein